MDKVGVFIADDNELVRYALRTLLEAEPEFAIVGEADDGEGAISGCGLTRPDVLVLGLRVSPESGAAICREARDRSPETAVLVVNADGGEGAFDARNAGACGYILEDTRPERVVEAVRSVAAGLPVFDAGRTPATPARPDGSSPHPADVLSEREAEVLQLMAKGLSNKEIGHALWIGETTVKTHVSHILRKLGAGDRTQAVLAAVKTGLVRLGG